MRDDPVAEAPAGMDGVRGADGDFPGPGDSLGLLTNIAARLFARAMQVRLAAHGASIGYYPVLLSLWERDGRTQKDLSKGAAIEPATLTRTLDRMERDGLVRRRRNPTDRREIHIHLTERGRALRRIITPEAAAINAMAMEGLGEEEVAALRSGLKHVIGRLLAGGYSFELSDECCVAGPGDDTGERRP